MKFKIDGKVFDTDNKRKINQLTRIEKAWKLVKGKKLSHGDISFKLGFSSLSIMKQTFQKLGLTTFHGNCKITDSMVAKAAAVHFETGTTKHLVEKWHITANRLNQRMREIGYSPSLRQYTDGTKTCNAKYISYDDILSSPMPLHLIERKTSLGAC